MNEQSILLFAKDPSWQNEISRLCHSRGRSFSIAHNAVDILSRLENTTASTLIIDADFAGDSLTDLIKLLPKVSSGQRIEVILLYTDRPSNSLNGSVDHYFYKKAGINNVLAQLETILKGSKDQDYSGQLIKVVGDLVVDRNSYLIKYKGRDITLPRKEFELVYLLASKPEKVFTREEIFNTIWNKPLTRKAGRTIDVHIRKLRSKISDDIITTIKGVGYRIM